MTVNPVPGGAPVSAGPGHVHTQVARRAVGLAEVVAVVVAVSYAIVGVAYAVGGSDAISDNWVGMLSAVALLGGLLHWMGWAMEPPIAMFALAGMGSTLAATTHSPLLAIIMVFELSLNYSLMPPLMLACSLALIVTPPSPASRPFCCWHRRGSRLESAPLDEATIRFN